LYRKNEKLLSMTLCRPVPALLIELLPSPAGTSDRGRVSFTARPECPHGETSIFTDAAMRARSAGGMGVDTVGLPGMAE
jgi:hypothetical protein